MEFESTNGNSELTVPRSLRKILKPPGPWEHQH